MLKLFRNRTAISVDISGLVTHIETAQVTTYCAASLQKLVSKLPKKKSYCWFLFFFLHAICSISTAAVMVQYFTVADIHMPL